MRFKAIYLRVSGTREACFHSRIAFSIGILQDPGIFGNSIESLTLGYLRGAFNSHRGSIHANMTASCLVFLPPTFPKPEAQRFARMSYSGLAPGSYTFQTKHAIISKLHTRLVGLSTGVLWTLQTLYEFLPILSASHS